LTIKPMTQTLVTFWSWHAVRCSAWSFH